MAAEYLPGTPGERIRDLRKEAKLNQEEFAEAIGISRSTLGDIELDKRSISSTTALEIAKYFNVSVDFVLAKTDDPNVINYDLKCWDLRRKRQINFIQIRSIPEFLISLLSTKNSES